MIRIHDDLEVGVATHTGQLRSHNEDDYLVLAPSDEESIERRGRLFVVADGMGGVSGGSEASRAAVRSFGTAFLDAANGSPEDTVRRGFAAACARVFSLSRESPRLKDMGSTMTAALLLGRQVVIGHVGDSRCLLVRGAEATQLTVDHAMPEPRNMLTRCIGAGQESEEVDLCSVDLEQGDVLLLMSDGLWTTVGPGETARCVRGRTAQDAADRLVELANERGGPDNCTVIVLKIRSFERTALREIELPSGEEPQAPGLLRTGRSLIPARWPWVLIALSAVLIGLVIARIAFGFVPFGG